MMRSLTLATALTAVLALSAMAADTTTKVDPNATGATAGAATATTAPTSAAPDSILLTEAEGKSWISKPIYTSDGSDVGKVVDFQRGADNRVTGMHADVGGFLGFDQTLVNLTAPQFKLQGDRVVLTLTAAEVKALPAAKI